MECKANDASDELEIDDVKDVRIRPSISIKKVTFKIVESTG